MATWITSDGQFKVESVSTVDKGQFVQVFRWAKWAEVWVFDRPSIRPPLGLSADQTSNYLLTELRRKGVNPADLIECDKPDWEYEAMKGGE